MAIGDEKKVSIAFTIDPELLEFLDAMAKENYLNRSAQIAQLVLEKHRDRLEKIDNSAK